MQSNFFKDLLNKQCFCQMTSSVLIRNSEKIYIKKSWTGHNFIEQTKQNIGF